MKKIKIGPKTFALSNKTILMGILNMTPDSFSDGGMISNVDEAIDYAKQMLKDGADIIDVGGESTRPGALPVSEKEELYQVIPVIDALISEKRIPISIDTTKSSVAEHAIDHGAGMVNDVSALCGDRNMVTIIREYQTPVCLMHMKGTPRDMQKNPMYIDVMGEIITFLKNRVKFALDHHVKKDQIILDPGIGFGKRTGMGVEDNCTILARLSKLNELGYPVMIGASRKQFIGNICGNNKPLPTSDRLEGSLAAVCVAALHGAAFIRVHDVKQTRRCLNVVNCIKQQLIE